MNRHSPLATRRSTLPCRGFTLLELIISISMLVIIIVIISAAMNIASRSIAAGEKKVEALERLRTSLSIMNAQIQSATPLTYSDQGDHATQGTKTTQGTGTVQGAQGVQGVQNAQAGQGTQATQGAQAIQGAQPTQGTGTVQGAQGAQPVQVTQKTYFTGNRTSLQLSTNYSIWGGQKGYVVVTYRVETDPSGKRALYATEHMVGIEASKQTKLLDGFDDIGFEYFQKGLTVGEPGTWVQDWTTDTAIPSKIRVYLLSGSKERLIILPIRTRPLAGGA
ncbi:MAG TPA: prepilin-type N-terminal cleavage/methylation domain-containing protein [Syntrophorhabdales bacterium]|nr:prepilin-type N-terminal cleavage/methylation domain-containing protein [Syntrophorhabdales bacterium]